MGNGTGIAYNYIVHSWDQLQLILNDGNGHFLGASPIDFDYAYAAVDGIGAYATPHQPQGALLMEWLTKALQQSQFDPGPQIGSGGWNFLTNDPSQLVTYPNAPGIWTNPGAMSASQRADLINAYMGQYVSKVTSFTAAQVYAGGFTTPTTVPVAAGYLADAPYVADKFAFMIPQLIYWGADTALVSQLATWAHTVWPSYNWSGDVDASSGCSLSSQGWVLCPAP